MSVERILIVFDRSAAGEVKPVKGIASYTEAGVCAPMAPETAAGLIPHAALLAQVQALQEEAVASLGDKARIAELEAQIAALTAAPADRIYLSDVYRRASDEENEAIEQMVATLPASQRNLLRSLQYFNPTDPDFPLVETALTTLFGAERAAELLAPSAA